MELADNLVNSGQRIAEVDLGAFLNGTGEERHKIAQEVDHICRSIGFLVIVNHGVSEDLCNAAWSSAESFFDLSSEQKGMSQSNDVGCPRGYFPIEGETLGRTMGNDTPPDRKETFSIGPLAPPTGCEDGEDFHFFYGPNIWPVEPNNFKDDWTSYYREMEKLGSQIMELLAVALKLDKDFFVKYHTHHISALRSQNYPSSSSPLLPGQLRAGAHSDYGTVTILNPDPKVGGLEVLSTSGKWIKPPVVENAFVINIGDLMARWTNDRWVSTLHRVVEPDTNSAAQSPTRQSIAYFMNPNFDAKISVIPTCHDNRKEQYPSVLAGSYLMDKFKISI